MNPQQDIYCGHLQGRSGFMPQRHEWRFLKGSIFDAEIGWWYCVHCRLVIQERVNMLALDEIQSPKQSA